MKHIITSIRTNCFDSLKPKPTDGSDPRIVRYMALHDGETLRSVNKYNQYPEGHEDPETGRPWFWMCRTSSGLPKSVVVGESVCFIAYKGKLIGYFDIVALGKLGEYSADPEDINTNWGQQQGVIMANWHPGSYGPQPGFQGWRYTEIRP